MDKIIGTVKKHWVYLVGTLAGGIGGYFYWLYIGCATGTCPITSSPYLSVLWGAIMGVLILSAIFEPKKKKRMLSFLNQLFHSSPKVDVNELLANGAELIDVRTKYEYLEGHAARSKNIPLDEISKVISKWDKEKTYILVCASGMRSRTAVSLLKRSGFEKVYNGGSWMSYV